MSEIDVVVFRNGKILKTIRRPVHSQAGGQFVTFRGERYPLTNGNQIHLDGATDTPAHGLQGEGAPRAALTPVRAEGWDPEQEAVIEAPRSARLIVDAGPGTGKTAVACARVAHLVNEGVEPANVWLISFTRTAVAEIRDRIRALAEDEARAAAVRISTLDSHAWHLREGFDLDTRDSLFGGYDENIESVIRLLRSDDEEVREYFESVEHLVIDEAQDLVGARAELVESIIELLSDDCGVTIFTDDAQAIYGFSEEDSMDSAARGRGTLPQRLRAVDGGDFRSLNLRTVHRTDSDSLKRIFIGTRKVVLDSGRNPDERLKQIISDVEESADGRVGDVLAQHLSGRDDTLVLFRRRSEVLTASTFLAGRGVRHRVRMSGLPTNLHPWLGLILRDFTEPFLAEDRFAGLWSDRVRAAGITDVSAGDAWNLLIRVAGDRAGRVEVRRLRERLSRKRPPVGLFSPEIGSGGPILGTIHASKGREAPIVHLMLPRGAKSQQNDHDETEEECRVIFVGATRARQALRVGRGYGIYTPSLRESGRLYSPIPAHSPRAKVEIGCENDLDAGLQVSRRLFRTKAEADRSQDLLQQRIGRIAEVTAQANAAADYRFELVLTGSGGDLRIGALSARVNGDLFAVGQAIAGSGRAPRLRPRFEMRHLWMLGVSTRVLSEDDPRLHELHPPYDRTGTFLVPVVMSFSVVYFQSC